MQIPVIVRLQTDDGKYRDITTEATASAIDRGEAILVGLPAFDESLKIIGFQIIAGPGEVLAARKLVFGPIYMRAGDTIVLTCKFQIFNWGQ